MFKGGIMKIEKNPIWTGINPVYIDDNKLLKGVMTKWESNLMEEKKGQQ